MALESLRHFPITIEGLPLTWAFSGTLPEESLQFNDDFRRNSNAFDTTYACETTNKENEEKNDKANSILSRKNRSGYQQRLWKAIPSTNLLTKMNILFWKKKVFSTQPAMVLLKRFRSIPLTLSQTSPGFYVSIAKIFWKHCGKRRNCT